MDTADKIGLLPGFGWVAGHDWWLTLIIVWGLTPVAMFILAPVLETRWLPWSPKRQFPSFFPGDFFLGLTVMGQLLLARQLPAEERWYNATWVNLLVLIATFVVACAMTWGEYRGGAYEPRAMYSPTKLYHNFILYCGYGYVAVVTLLANCAGADWTWPYAGWFVLTLLPGLVWIGLVVMDGVNAEASARRARTAHDADWLPVWP